MIIYGSFEDSVGISVYMVDGKDQFWVYIW